MNTPRLISFVTAFVLGIPVSVCAQRAATPPDTLGVDALVSALAERRHLFGDGAVDECSVLKLLHEDTALLVRFRQGERGTESAASGPARCRPPDPDAPMSPEWWITAEEIDFRDEDHSVLVDLVARHPGEFRKERYRVDRTHDHAFVVETRIERGIATNDFQALISPRDWPGFQPGRTVSAADSLRAEAVIAGLRTRAAMFGRGIVSDCALQSALQFDDRLVGRVKASPLLSGTVISDAGCVRPTPMDGTEAPWWVVLGSIEVAGSVPRQLHLTAYGTAERRESYVFDRPPGNLRVIEVRIEP